MNKWLKASLAATGIALVAMIALGSAALAQGPTGTPGFGRGPKDGAPHHSIVPAAAKVLGMSESDLESALRSGKTIADVAKEKGVALDKVADAVVAAHAEELKTAVKAGRLTQAQADENLARFKENITKILTSKPPVRGRQAQFGDRANSPIAIAAKTLGMSESDLLTTLRSGKSIADVAKEKNVPLDKIADAIVAARTTELKNAVSAGRITQARADEILARLKENMNNLLTSTRPLGGPGFRGAPGGPRPTPTPKSS